MILNDLMYLMCAAFCICKRCAMHMASMAIKDWGIGWNSTVQKSRYRWYFQIFQTRIPINHTDFHIDFHVFPYVSIDFHISQPISTPKIRAVDDDCQLRPLKAAPRCAPLRRLIGPILWLWICRCITTSVNRRPDWAASWLLRSNFPIDLFFFTGYFLDGSFSFYIPRCLCRFPDACMFITLSPLDGSICNGLMGLSIYFFVLPFGNANWKRTHKI